MTLSELFAPAREYDICSCFSCDDHTSHANGSVARGDCISPQYVIEWMTDHILDYVGMIDHPDLRNMLGILVATARLAPDSHVYVDIDIH